MGWQRSRSSPGAGETRWVYDAGAVCGPRSAPAGRHGAGRFVCQVAVRGLRSALVGRPNTSAEMKRSAVCGLRRRDALLSGLAARAKPLDAPVFYSASVFDVPILPFAMLVPRLPIFWALLQKNGPKFDVTPELLGGFRGTILCRIFLTWGNACARGRISPFSLAKPPRSSGDPTTVA